MASPSVHEGDQIFKGNVAISGTFTPPDNSITNAKIAAGAGIEVSKLDHRHTVVYGQPDETPVVHDRKFLYKADEDGILSNVTFAVGSVIPAGATTVSFNIRKSTAGGAWVDILTEIIIAAAAVTGSVEGTIPVVRVPQTCVVGTAAYIAGDLFEICVWTLSSGASAMAQGLVVSAVFDEEAQ